MPRRDDSRDAGRGRGGDRGEERRSFRERDDDREARRDRRGDRESRRDDRPPRSRSPKRRRDEERRSPSRGRSGDRGAGNPADEPRMKQRPSGFDQKQMLPENYAVMQMNTMRTPPPATGAMGGAGGKGGFPGGGMMGGCGGMGGMMMPQTNTVTNPEVELFLQHNPVEPHAATRLRSLPVELQKIVLSRGSLFGGRDPTAVLLGRVRAATRGISGPVMGTGGARMPWSGTTAFEGSEQQQAPQQQPPPPQESWGQTQPQTSAPRPGQAEPEAAWARSSPGSYGSGPGQQGDSQPKEAWETQAFGAEPEKPRNAARQPNSDSVLQAFRNPTGLKSIQGQRKEPESEKCVELRGMMQSSVGELSEKLLGKKEAHQAGLVEEDDMDIDTGSGKRLAAPTPSFNPFRSKARAAPVATEPDPPPMDVPADFNLMHTPSVPNPSDMGAQPPQQQMQGWQPPQQEQQVQANMPQQHAEQESPGLASALAVSVSGGMPQPPPAPEPKQVLWAPSAQDLADLNVPPGIAVRMIRENMILADEDNMPIIPYEGGAPATAKDGIGDLAKTGESTAIGTQLAVAAKDGDGAADAAADAADPAASSDSAGKELKRTQAITTLGFYGLTDPNNQEDVAKAVQAVAAATGEQNTAVALWHMMAGTSGEGGQGGVQALTEEQITEVEQAAQQAQYSQYWLQQQFQSQLAMFENQRLMAVGDNALDNPNDAQASAARGPRGDPSLAGKRKPASTQAMLPGDWTCPGCGDHQFARNRVCRFCGASRPIGSH